VWDWRLLLLVLGGNGQAPLASLSLFRKRLQGDSSFLFFLSPPFFLFLDLGPFFPCWQWGSAGLLEFFQLVAFYTSPPTISPLFFPLVDFLFPADCLPRQFFFPDSASYGYVDLAQRFSFLSGFSVLTSRHPATSPPCPFCRRAFPFPPPFQIGDGSFFRPFFFLFPHREPRNFLHQPCSGFCFFFFFFHSTGAARPAPRR